MPPRRSGRLAAAAVQRTCAFPQLPLEAVLAIFALLPPDQRLRCAEVCRGWRATVAHPALWRHLDISRDSEVARFRNALVHAALARAGAALTTLALVNLPALDVVALCDALRATGAGAALQVLHLGNAAHFAERMHDVLELLEAAPQLRELHLGVRCPLHLGVDLLRGAAPFAPVRLQELELVGPDDPREGPPRTVLPLALALALADTRLHPGLSRLSVKDADLLEPGVMDALADAVAARRSVDQLSLLNCVLQPAPALARLLREGAFSELELSVEDGVPFFDVAGATALGAALRAHANLDVLTVWILAELAAPAMAALLRALAGHSSLSVLNVYSRNLPAAELGAALATLLVADAPELRGLSLDDCVLDDALLNLLCFALARNRNLRRLSFLRTPLPAGFVRTRLLPAVRANTGLTWLEVNTAEGDDAAALEEALHFLHDRIFASAEESASE